MRITFAMQGETTISSLNGKAEEYGKTYDALSSGSRLSTPSDDPYAWSRSMDVRQGLREYDSLLGNIDFANGWNSATSSALNSLSDLVSEAKQVAMKASSGGDSGQSATLANQVDGIISQAVGLLNSQYGDQYVFAGTKTTTSPYAIDSSGNVTYSGDTSNIKVRTQRMAGSSTTVNVTGPDVVDYTSGGSPTNLLSELYGLKTAITSGSSDDIAKKLDTLQDAYDNINTQSALVGTRLSNLTDQKTTINSLVTNDKSTLSDLSDTDLTDAVVKLQQQQTAYEAALKATAMVSDLSLTKYIS